MSRAFVNEDAGGTAPRKGYGLPPGDDPGFDAEAAEALRKAARAGGDDRLEQLAERYLR